MKPSLSLVLLLLGAMTGCGDDPPPPPAPRPAASRPATAAASANATGARPGNNSRTQNERPPPPPAQITDQSFIEDIARARDPFHSYFSIYIVTSGRGIDATRDVKLARYTLDDLRLVAVVIGTDSPYAMVVDPSRTGTILRRGMYVGRQEIIQSAQGAYNINWRVARIEPARLRRMPDGQFDEIPAALVFERQNPLDSTAQVVERSLPLAAGGPGARGQAQQQAVPLGPIPGVGSETPNYLPPNLGGGGSTNGIVGTQQALNNPSQTTVVVQVPPAQTNIAPMQPSNAPPPVNVYNGNARSP
jgi:type IV pilus assembly protein PilP